MTVHASSFTSGELALCVKVGLLHEVSPGTFELTARARLLLGERPQRAKLETLGSWLARISLLAVVFLAACSGAPEPQPSRPSRFVLEPATPELADAADVWGERWQAATGLEVVVGAGAGAIPVRFVEDMIDPDGKDGPHCAQTELRWPLSSGPEGPYRVAGVSIDPTPPRDCPDDWRIALGHEFGHVLGGRVQHSESGIFRAHISTPRELIIDAASLEAVCLHSPCLTFTPEEFPPP